METVTIVELGHGVAYAYGPNGMTGWVVLDGRKWGKTYRGETAHTDAERDAFDLVMRRGR
jgi:hypothetical protein